LALPLTLDGDPGGSCALDLGSLPLPPSPLRIPVALATGSPIFAGRTIDLPVVSVAALPLAYSGAAVIGPSELLQVGRLNAVLDATPVVDVQKRIVFAHEDRVSRNVRPGPTSDLLIDPPLIAAATHDQTALVCTS